MQPCAAVQTLIKIAVLLLSMNQYLLSGNVVRQNRPEILWQGSTWETQEMTKSKLEVHVAPLIQ